MRARLALALIVVATVARRAHADDIKPAVPGDPPLPKEYVDVFGFSPRKAPAPLDCTAGDANFGCAMSTDPFAAVAPFTLSTWLSGSYLMSLPVGDATHDQVAAYALGASRDGAGPSFGGATGLENRWTIEGAPADNILTGGVDTVVPLSFLAGMRVGAGGFAARDRVSTGGTIDVELIQGGKDHVLDVRAWVGDSANARAIPPAINTYSIRQGHTDPGPTATASIVASGPLGELLGGRAWYALGLAPSLHYTDFTWQASRLVDKDHDGVPDGIPGLPELDPIETTKAAVPSWLIPVMARAGLDRGADHLALTLIGEATHSTYNLFNATEQAAGVDTLDYVGDAIATFRHEVADTHFRAQIAWHFNDSTQSAHDSAAQNLPQYLSAYIPPTLADDPALAQACTDPASSKITGCPVPAGYFASAGAGMLQDTTANRLSATADVVHVIAGNALRFGVTGEDSKQKLTSFFTGNTEIISLFPGATDVVHLLGPDQTCSTDPSVSCAYENQTQLTYRTLYAAAYAEDTFHLAPNVDVDAGLRWELMWVGTNLHFSNELAPRLGATWDPLGGGRSRVWASMGRSFVTLPAGVDSFLLPGTRTVEDITGPFGQGRFVRTSPAIVIASGIEPMTQDEVTLGGEVALAGTLRLTTWLQGRRLYRGIDTTTDGFDNPGRADGNTPEERQTELVAAQFESAPTTRLVLRLGYMFGRTIGSSTGAYDPRQGAVLYGGSDYDVTAANQLGFLPTDAGHRVYIEAQTHGSAGSVRLAFSTRLTAASGLPRDVLGNGGYGVVELLPRGSDGRGPTIAQANIRLMATWRRFELSLDVFNVFDRRDPTAVGSIYTNQSLLPISGGEMADLVFAHDVNGHPLQLDTYYRLPTSFQSPFGAMLGLHRRF